MTHGATGVDSGVDSGVDRDGLEGEEGAGVEEEEGTEVVVEVEEREGDAIN